MKSKKYKETGLQPYRVPKTESPIDLHLEGNEGQAPPASLLAGLDGQGGDVLRRYPDAGPLEHLLARRLGAAPERLIVSAGGDDLIDRICKATLEQGRELVLPAPTFPMIERFARVAAGTVRRVPWPAGPYPLKAVLRAVNKRTGLIAVVSPNNPTGAVAAARDLRILSKRAGRALLLVDLAYAEFADRDLTPAAMALPNAVVLRTLSKAWGLAGLRVGYAAGPAPLIERLRACGTPYAVSGLSLAVAERWLRRGGVWMRHFVSRIHKERDALIDLLQRLGAHPFPSQANFILSRFSDADAVWQGLARKGIAVRIFPGDPDLAGCLRITCPGDAHQYARLASTLKEVMKKSVRGELVEPRNRIRAKRVVRPSTSSGRTVRGVV